MWRLDEPIVMAILESVSMKESVGYLRLVDANENVLFLYGDKPPVFSVESRELRWGSSLIGTVGVGLDAGFRESIMRDVAIAAFATGSVIVALQGFFIVFLSSNLLRKPLNQLQEMAKLYAAGVYKSAERAKYSEFAPVMETMDDMGRKILSQLSEIGASEARLKSFYTQSPLGIFRSTIDGELIDANPALLSIFNANDRSQFRKDLYANPEDRDWLVAGVKSKPDGVVVDVDMLKVDGMPFVARIHAIRSKDDQDVMEGLVEDITERKEAEERLRLSEEKFEQLFQRSPYPIFLEDVPSRRIVDANDAFFALVGASREECIGAKWDGIVAITDISAKFLLEESLRESGVLDGMECPVKTRKNEHKVVALTARPVTLDSTVHVMVISQDITEQKTLREAVIHSEKMASVGRITAGVAHEINNPLGIILQAAQNLGNRVNPEFPPNVRVAKEIGLDIDLLAKYVEARKILAFAKDIQDAGIRAAGIIRNMLDFSRKSPPCRTMCDIGVVVERAIQLASSDYALRRNFDCGRIEVASDIPVEFPTVNCCETEIEQVLINLIRNAGHALAENADGCSSPPRIDVRARTTPGFVEIEVQDNGPGMPEDVRSRVFEPFFTTKPPGQGTGLGLSVSYFIVTTGHKGEMTVKSSPGHGATFRMKLPLHDSDDPDQCES
jgi:PAS domain S-box-containing protein